MYLECVLPLEIFPDTLSFPGPMPSFLRASWCQYLLLDTCKVFLLLFQNMPPRLLPSSGPSNSSFKLPRFLSVFSPKEEIPYHL